MVDWRSQEFKRSCSRKLTSQQMKRMDKLYIDEFYLMDAAASSDPETVFVYSVSGSHGTPYTIQLKSGGSFRCDCLDSQTHCRKHGVVCKRI